MSDASAAELPQDFHRLIRARFLFNFAVRTQAVIVGWTMYALTKDALALGLVGLAEAIPALSLALVSGYIVDRSRPVRIYTGVITASLLSALVVLLSQLPYFNLDLSHRIAALYVSSVIGGAARGFSQPAMFAIVPGLLARVQLSRGAAMMSSAQQIASILGPAVGGLLYGGILGYEGVEPPAVLACLMLAAALQAVTSIQKEVPAPKMKEGQVLSQELLSGIRFVFRHPLLLPALSLDMFSVLFAGVTALLPIFADQVLHTGAMGLGALRAAPAIGASATSLVLSRRLIRGQAGTLLFSCVGAFGLCQLGFGLSHSFALSFVLLVLSGAFDNVSAVIRNTSVQLASPDSMRGRISAVNSIFIGSSNELGEFESGVAAKLMGTVPAVIFGGVACLVTVVVVYVCAPALRRLDLAELERNGPVE